MGWTFYSASGQQLQSTVNVVATKAQMEAATSTGSFVTPGRTQYHPGAAKAWVYIAADGTIVGSTSYPNSYNIAGVTDTGTGDRTVTWDTDFSSTTYVTVTGSGGDDSQVAVFHGWAVGSVNNDCYVNGSLADFLHFTVAFGAQ